MEPDYTSEPFITRREPVREMICSFNSLYLESEGEVAVPEEDNDSSHLPPPPPEEEDGSLISLTIAMKMRQLEIRMEKMEKESVDRVQGVDVSVQNYLQQYDRHLIAIEGLMPDLIKLVTTQSSFNQSLKKLEEELVNFVEEKSTRLEKTLENQLQEMGRTMMDCMERRDNHLKSSLCPIPGATSTPTTTLIPDAQLIPMQHQLPYRMAIKIEFPKFGSIGAEDPIAYLEKCAEYLAVRPMSDAEILATLPSVLTHTAKDWWVAEKAQVKTWGQFKTAFLRSFLPDDHEVEAERRIRERKQGIDEDLRTFAFQYRALCLRLKPTMSEKEMLQAALRNCNPQIASVLRGTVATFDDLVCTGALVERDIDEERAFWKQRQAEQSSRRGGQDKYSRGKHGSHSMALVTRGNVKLLTLTITLRGQSCEAILDTGSSYSLIQESSWRRWKDEAESWRSCRGQTFTLANGHIQRALGEVTWECALKGCTNPLRLFIMRDEDLAFQLILGLESLVTCRVKLDFDTSTYSLPGEKETLHPFSCYDQPPSVNIHCALPIVQVSSDTAAVIKDLVGLADASRT